MVREGQGKAEDLAGVLWPSTKSQFQPRAPHSPGAKPQQHLCSFGSCFSAFLIGAWRLELGPCSILGAWQVLHWPWSFLVLVCLLSFSTCQMLELHRERQAHRNLLMMEHGSLKSQKIPIRTGKKGNFVPLTNNPYLCGGSLATLQASPAAGFPANQSGKPRCFLPPQAPACSLGQQE